MAQAKSGDTVKVHHTGTLEDGTVFDSSIPREEPLEFTIGDNKLIPAFEEAVVGMDIGDSKSIVVDGDNAYGPRNEEMIMAVDRSNIPEDLPLEVGSQLKISQDDGHSMIVMITAVTDDKVTLDANHPLAGKDLSFEIELVEIV